MINQSLNELSDRLLDTIRRSRKNIPLESLSKRLKAPKADIIFALDLLRSAGYEIETDNVKFCRFKSAPDLLLATELKYRLKTKSLGHTVYSYKTLQSTNTIAARLADAGAPEGTIIVAETQSRGRGRQGRSWHSPAGMGIYLSIILYPDINPETAPGLSIISAVSLADVLAGYKGLKPQIKWPNDCLLNGRKTAGILTELAGKPGRVHYVIVGVGININQRRADFPEEIRKTATSVGREYKKNISRVKLAQDFLVNFEKDFLRFKKSGLKYFRKKILGYSSLVGKKVKLDKRGEIITGKAVDIDANGRLVVETPDGPLAVYGGEVTVIK